MKLGNAVEAEEIYRDLVKRNPENGSYYEGIEKCLAAKNDGKRKFLIDLVLFSVTLFSGRYWSSDLSLKNGKKLSYRFSHLEIPVDSFV